MTKPELPETNDQPKDLLDEAISWFTGRDPDPVEAEEANGGDADLAADAEWPGAGESPSAAVAAEPVVAAPAGVDDARVDVDHPVLPESRGETEATPVYSPRSGTSPDRSVDAVPAFVNEIDAEAPVRDVDATAVRPAYVAEIPEGAIDSEAEWRSGAGLASAVDAAADDRSGSVAVDHDPQPDADRDPAETAAVDTPVVDTPVVEEDATSGHEAPQYPTPEPAVSGPDGTGDADYPARPEPPASLFRDESVAPAAVAAAAGAGAAVAGAGAAAAGAAAADRTALIEQPDAAQRRAEEREARDRQLGRVQPLTAAEPAAPAVALPSTYKALPSLGLLILRWVTAGIIGIRAFMHVMDIAALQKLWADHTILAPQAATVAWVQTGVEALIVILLIFGFGTRLAGALLTALAACLLAFMLWGAANPVQAGEVRFMGDIEVLLAAVGLFFLTTGGGRAGIDGSIHASRVDRKNERLAA